MKIKTNTLTGAALDWAVAKCEGRPYSVILNDIKGALPLLAPIFSPSTSWEVGGPLIEREHIQLQYLGYDNPPYWGATKFTPSAYHRWITFGPTPLVAAMRCFVASRLGESVEVPDELTEGEK